MRTLEGSAFRGTIMPASDQQGSPFEFSSSRVILRTRGEVIIGAGSVFRARPGGPRYIVGEHYAAEDDYRSWKLFLIERELTWKRMKPTTDDLTGLVKNSGSRPEDLGTIYAAVEHDRRLFTDPGLKLRTEKVTLVTNSPVQPKDIVNNELVTRVTEDLGLFILEYT
jgi:hypothetical protein